MTSAHTHFLPVGVTTETPAISADSQPPPVFTGVAGAAASATPEQHGRAAMNLLPPSRLWPTQSGALLRLLLVAIGARFAALEARANALLTDIYPPSTVELLPDWERALGLPDECTPLGKTEQERRARVVQKLTLEAKPTAVRFAAIAAQLGYEGVTVEDGPEPRQFTVTVPTGRITWFRAGESRCGDSLASFESATDLECILSKEKPAHTRLNFSYTGD